MLNDVIIYLMSCITCFSLGMNVMAWIKFSKGECENEHRNIDRERCTLEELREEIRRDIESEYYDSAGFQREY